MKATYCRLNYFVNISFLCKYIILVLFDRLVSRMATPVLDDRQRLVNLVHETHRPKRSELTTFGDLFQPILFAKVPR